jgi:type II secretory pathway component HofQ
MVLVLLALTLSLFLFQTAGYSQQSYSEDSQNKWTGEKISFDFKDLDIKDFFRFIADFSGNDIILDSGVKGTVTMKLKDVPWDQAMDLVCKTYGLGYQIESKSGSARKKTFSVHN